MPEPETISATATAWLTDHPRQVITEPCPVPLWVGVAPVWSDLDGAGFYAFMALDPAEATAWECEHVHSTPSDAWDCLRSKLLAIAAEVPTTERANHAH